MVKQNVFAVAFILALSGCAGNDRVNTTPDLTLAPVAAETVPAPQWRVGSEWLYNDGYGLKVIRVDGPLTTFQRLDDPTQWVTRRGFLRENAQSATTLRKLLYENLPSGAGLALPTKSPLVYRREYMAGPTQRTHATSWIVEGRETVNVPAGMFDCIVLTMRTRSIEDGWTGYERWWFSPAVQNYVRLEYRYGPDTGGSRVLTRYQLAP